MDAGKTVHSTPSNNTTTGSSKHHSHHHHHQHQGTSTAMASGGAHPPQRSRKEENLLLSLPSQDKEIWYDNGPLGITDDYALSDDEEQDPSGIKLGRDHDLDYSPYTKTPHLTNRGHKLSAGSQFIRKGRLGGWENHEIFESRSVFPSNLHFPGTTGASNVGGTGGAHGGPSSSSHTSAAAAAGARSLLRPMVERKLPNSFPITTNLTLVPSSSTAAARPDKNAIDLLSQPVPAAGDDAESSSRKRQKRHHISGYSQLASTTSSSASYTSVPVRAYLPKPPTNPVELISSPIISKTFSRNNRMLEKLSLSTIELIEQDLPYYSNLTRLNDFLRGNAISGITTTTIEGGEEKEGGGLISLPFLGDNERIVQPADDKPDEEAAAPDTQGDEKDKELQSEKRPDDAPVDAEVTTVVEGAVEASKADPSADKAGEAMAVDQSKPNAAQETVKESVAGGAVTDKDNAESRGGDETVIKLENPEASVPAGQAEGVPASTTENAVVATTAPGDISAMQVDSAADDTAANTVVAPSTTDESTEPSVIDPPQANGSLVDQQHRSRSTSTSSHTSSSAENNAHGTAPSIKFTKLPKSIQRIANPQPFVESLFVTPHDIVVPLSAKAAAEGLVPYIPPEGSSRADAGPASAMIQGDDGEVEINYNPETHMRLTPEEQAKTVELCLNEITRCLADSLEYQDRLAEIRDSILGVERRRKGVWAMARGYAHQLLWEEEQTKMANGML